MRRRLLVFVAAAVLAVSSIGTVFAQPTGPGITACAQATAGPAAQQCKPPPPPR